MQRHCFGYALYGEEGNKLNRLGQHASDRKQDFVCLEKIHPTTNEKVSMIEIGNSNPLIVVSKKLKT